MGPVKILYIMNTNKEDKLKAATSIINTYDLSLIPEQICMYLHQLEMYPNIVLENIYLIIKKLLKYNKNLYIAITLAIATGHHSVTGVCSIFELLSKESDKVLKISCNFYFSIVTYYLDYFDFDINNIDVSNVSEKNIKYFQNRRDELYGGKLTKPAIKSK